MPPLDPDPDCDGSPSDHLMVEMRPISTISNRSVREKRKVKFRPLPQSGMLKFGEWLSQQTWDEVYNANDVHEKAACFQQKLMKALDEYLPEKTVTFSSDDQPWMTAELKELDRKKKRVFRKQRKSEK